MAGGSHCLCLGGPICPSGPSSGHAKLFIPGKVGAWKRLSALTRHCVFEKNSVPAGMAGAPSPPLSLWLLQATCTWAPHSPPWPAFVIPGLGRWASWPQVLERAASPRAPGRGVLSSSPSSWLSLRGPLVLLTVTRTCCVQRQDDPLSQAVAFHVPGPGQTDPFHVICMEQKRRKTQA